MPQNFSTLNDLQCTVSWLHHTVYIDIEWRETLAAGKFGKFAAKLLLAEKNWQIFPSSNQKLYS